MEGGRGKEGKRWKRDRMIKQVRQNVKSTHYMEGTTCDNNTSYYIGLDRLQHTFT